MPLTLPPVIIAATLKNKIFPASSNWQIMRQQKSNDLPGLVEHETLVHLMRPCK